MQATSPLSSLLQLPKSSKFNDHYLTPPPPTRIQLSDNGNDHGGSLNSLTLGSTSTRKYSSNSDGDSNDPKTTKTKRTHWGTEYNCGKIFGRSVELERHTNSVHGDRTVDGPIDCSHEGCWYVGELGFKRQDSGDLALHLLVPGDRSQGALPVLAIAGSAAMAPGIGQLFLHPQQEPFGLMNQRPIMREEESESPLLLGKPQKSFCGTPLQGRPPGPIAFQIYGGTGLVLVLGATHQKETTSIRGHVYVDWQLEVRNEESGSPSLLTSFEKPQKSFCGTSSQVRPRSPIACPSHDGAGLAPALRATHRKGKEESSIWEHELAQVLRRWLSEMANPCGVGRGSLQAMFAQVTILRILPFST